MEKILECKNVCKNFGKKQILKDISFTLNSGDILAFIGPNGAGKTTMIKLILGLQKITSGEIYINNYNIKTKFVKAIERVGAIVENPDMYMYLTGWQNLKIIANTYPNITDEKIREIVKLVKLEDRINDKVSKYSLGMRQRLGIAKSLINEPNLLILDEPTNGLDPEGIKDLRILLNDLSKEGIGILISSHNLWELESFCNKVLIINKGSIIENNEVTKFKNNGEKYIFRVDNTKNIKELEIENITSNSFVYRGNKEDVAKMVKKLVEKDIKIYEVKEEELTLEEAFLKKTGGNK